MRRVFNHLLVYLFLVIISFVLAILKFANVIPISWYLILLPTWLPVAFYSLLFLGIGVANFIDERKKKK